MSMVRRFHHAIPFALAAAVALTSCRSTQQTTAQPEQQVATPSYTRTPPAWSRSATIYEINVRQYTPEGTLNALLPHLPQIRSLGTDIVWVMPVQPIGVKNRKGGLGSYYSISDYTAINPEFGTEADFRRFVDSAHALGMKVILDWVGNHTAFDHKWVTSHRDFYTNNPDGSISNARDDHNNPTDWTDVAELNYDNKALWTAMLGEMRWWVDRMNVDGFRCDVAGGVPMEFWNMARTALASSKHDLFWLAESENSEMQSAFDMTYGWEFHHLLNDLAQGKQPTSALDQYLAKQKTRFGPDAYRMYFTSNHDENTWAGTEFDRMGENHLAAYVLAGTWVQGMPELYSGQEMSNHKRLRFFEKDTIDWSGPSLASFYSAMFALKHANAALWNGAYGGPQLKLSTNGGDRVYAFTRTKDENTVLVAVNFGDAAAHVAYTGLPKEGDYTDWFSKTKVDLDEAGTIDIPAHGYRVLVK